MNVFEIEKPDPFDLSQTLCCGQCFRFERLRENVYEGVAFGMYVRIEQQDAHLRLFCPEGEAAVRLWTNFFDLQTDYARMAASFREDAVLAEAARYSSGIRLLKQDRWEALCSFIISQNNNIPRIKGIIAAISRRYGTEVWRDAKGKAFYSFPSARALYDAGVDELYAMKTGFRAKYIYDAARTVCENPGFLDETALLPTPDAVQRLKTVRGVGDKVAACALLYGFSRYDAFPVDVWVKRVLTAYYPQGLTPPLSGPFAGLAQQYLFYYERCRNRVFLS
ncbi:MAG: DNA-3-methyladenine glycosylase family protein [Eubacteriales bacterium]